MERKSFVFHFEYLADIPEELRGEWAMYIINYAESGVEPTFNSWSESKLWNAIKNRIDVECAEYSKKVANLKQNKKKSEDVAVEPEEVSTVSDTEETMSNTDNTVSDTENDLSVGVYVYDSVSESDSESDFVYVQPVDKPPEHPPKPKKQKKSHTPTPKPGKPCLNDVIAYCQEKNYTFRPEKFFKHYDSVNWKIGVTPIRDWKSKCDEWQQNQMDFRPTATVSRNEKVDEFESFFMNKGIENATQSRPNQATEYSDF